MNFLRNCRDTLRNADPEAADPAYYPRRRARHAGSWYPADADALDGRLTRCLAAAAAAPSAEGGAGGAAAGVAHACVAPHAGLRFSGPTAAHAYLALREALATNAALATVVVLHPSHHVYLDGCSVSGASSIETPLGDLAVDTGLRKQLLSTNKFEVMEQRVDEEEHSGEMQYPFIAKIINDANSTLTDHGKTRREVRILPIMVGALDASKEKAFGRLLQPYLADRGTFTVVSSDFCHWGRRFDYTPHDAAAAGEAHEYIARLDRRGMDLIESQRPGAFADYLRETSNTICGRHPIAVWLNALRYSMLTHSVRFVKYDQSDRACSTEDHSVSYASAVARVAMFDG